jgi:hypothetical protein
MEHARNTGYDSFARRLGLRLMNKQALTKPAMLRDDASWCGLLQWVDFGSHMYFEEWQISSRAIHANDVLQV